MPSSLCAGRFRVRSVHYSPPGVLSAGHPHALLTHLGPQENTICLLNHRTIPLAPTETRRSTRGETAGPDPRRWPAPPMRRLPRYRPPSLLAKKPSVRPPLALCCIKARAGFAQRELSQLSFPPTSTDPPAQAHDAGACPPAAAAATDPTHPAAFSLARPPSRLRLEEADENTLAPGSHRPTVQTFFQRGPRAAATSRPSTTPSRPEGLSLLTDPSRLPCPLSTRLSGHHTLAFCY